jgi:hypothetical protein
MSYCITNVPRLIGQITDRDYSLVPVEAQAVAQAVQEAITYALTAVTETTYSMANPSLLYSCWFVNFPEGTLATIPRQLCLFGIVAIATYLPRKTTVVQCSRC